MNRVPFPLNLNPYAPRPTRAERAAEHRRREQARLDAQQELMALLELREGPTLEFKREPQRPWRMARVLAALANGHGGQLVLGVDDWGRVRGVPDPAGWEEQVREAATTHCEPAVPLRIVCRQLEAGTVMVVTVEAGQNRPYRVRHPDGKLLPYVRVGDRCHPATARQQAALERDRPSATVVRSLSADAQAALELARRHRGLTADELCRRRNLSERRARRLLVELLRLGILLEERNCRPPRYIPGPDAPPPRQRSRKRGV